MDGGICSMSVISTTLCALVLYVECCRLLDTLFDFGCVTYSEDE